MGVLWEDIQRHRQDEALGDRSPCKKRLAARDVRVGNPIRSKSRTNSRTFSPIKATKILPLMFVDDGGPFLCFTRFALTGLPSYPRGPDAPKLTPEQADALDTVQYFAEKNAVEIEQEKGDILLVNNRAVLHARDKIQDACDESDRHLMRLCLRDTEYGRRIPDDLKRRWGDLFDNHQHKDGKWMLSKEHHASFVSNSKFDSAFPWDETSGSHG